MPDVLPTPMTSPSKLHLESLASLSMATLVVPEMVVPIHSHMVVGTVSPLMSSLGPHFLVGLVAAGSIMPAPVPLHTPYTEPPPLQQA